MKCLNKLCVYQKNNECMCENVKIDWRGCCVDMINIRLTQDVIKNSKFYTKLILEHNDDYYFDDEIGEFIYLVE